MAFNGKGGGYDIKKYYRTPIYSSWFNMKTRCLNKNNKNYLGYGARGISVSDDWLLFKNFLADMLPTHRAGLSLGRINNNKGYCKENCRWETPLQQANNTRNIERAKKYCVFGRLVTIKDLADKFNIKRSTLSMRLQQYGWPLHKALNT